MCFLKWEKSFMLCERARSVGVLNWLLSYSQVTSASSSDLINDTQVKLESEMRQVTGLRNRCSCQNPTTILVGALKDFECHYCLQVPSGSN